MAANSDDRAPVHDQFVDHGMFPDCRSSLTSRLYEQGIEFESPEVDRIVYAVDCV